MLTLFIILFPFVSAAIILLSPSEYTKKLAVASGLGTIGLTLVAMGNYQSTQADKIWELNLPWIKSLGISFHVGMDGISLVMLMLSSFVTLMAVLTSLNDKFAKLPLYYALLLIMQGAMNGVFVSLDLFIYYIFWELALIPAYFLILMWGDGETRMTTIKFFLYTLMGSLFMLLGIIWLGNMGPSAGYDINTIYELVIGKDRQLYIFMMFMFAYAIKIPIFPFHTWQPDTYTKAPVAVTIMLSGIMLKMAIYSIIRWVIPVVPLAVEVYGKYFILAAVVGILYASMIALVQKDLKRLFAYASIAHVGLITAGILTVTKTGVQGGILQMLAHGVNVVGLFYITQILRRYKGTNEITAFGGIRITAPVFAGFYMVIMFGSIALPLTNGFPGEFMLLNALYQTYPWMSLVAASGVILGAVYMLVSYQKVMSGEIPDGDGGVPALNNIDKLVFIPVILMILAAGLFPQWIMNISDGSVDKIINLYQTEVNTFLNK